MAQRVAGLRRGQLTGEQTETARELHEAGESFRAIARTLCVGREAVRAALRVPAYPDGAADQPGDELGPADRPIYQYPEPATPSLASIREAWAYNRASGDDQGWYPPTIGADPIAYATERKDLSW